MYIHVSMIYFFLLSEPSETDGLTEHIDGDLGLVGATPVEEVPPTPAEPVETPTEEKGKSKYSSQWCVPRTPSDGGLISGSKTKTPKNKLITKK